MNTTTTIHVEEKDTFELSEEKNAIGEPYRTLHIGSSVVVYGPTEAFEKLYSILDGVLHDVTYSEIEAEKLRLEIKLETTEEENEQLREIIDQRRR